jgi:hypothetical protein
VVDLCDDAKATNVKELWKIICVSRWLQVKFAPFLTRKRIVHYRIGSSHCDGYANFCYMGCDSVLKEIAASTNRSSETTVHLYKTTRRHSPEDSRILANMIIYVTLVQRVFTVVVMFQVLVVIEICKLMEICECDFVSITNSFRHVSRSRSSDWVVRLMGR